MGDRNKNRIWELDFLRGIALLLMIYFHVVYDMKDLYDYNVVYWSGVNFYIGRISAVMFMLLAGISSSLSRNNIKRGLRVLAAAAVITAVTHIFSPGLGIKFGILHFLSVGMLLSPALIKLDKYLLAFLGVLFLAGGRLISKINVSHDWFFIFGLHSGNFVSSDYYPLIPWLGVFLLGLAAGRLLYAERRSLFKFSPGENPISFVGRHTLIVYLVHQPMIIAALELVERL